MSNYSYNYRNYFMCPIDGTYWDDEWECMCNDRCPECDTEIEPYMSEDLRNGHMVVHAQEVYDKASALHAAELDNLHKNFDKL